MRNWAKTLEGMFPLFEFQHRAAATDLLVVLGTPAA